MGSVAPTELTLMGKARVRTIGAPLMKLLYAAGLARAMTTCQQALLQENVTGLLQVMVGVRARITRALSPQLQNVAEQDLASTTRVESQENATGLPPVILLCAKTTRAPSPILPYAVGQDLALTIRAPSEQLAVDSLRVKTIKEQLSGPARGKNHATIVQPQQHARLTKLNLTCYNYFVLLPEGQMHESTCSLYYRSAESGEGNMILTLVIQYHISFEVRPKSTGK
jgi:hypothetical protein